METFEKFALLKFQLYWMSPMKAQRDYFSLTEEKSATVDFTQVIEGESQQMH